MKQEAAERRQLVARGVSPGCVVSSAEPRTGDTALACLSIAVVAGSLAGCAIRTPDGVQLPKGSDESRVCAALGPPDIRYERMKYGIDKWTCLYYVDRRYVAQLRWDRLQRVDHIDPGQQQDLERQVRVLREIVPSVKIGGSADELIGQLGPPDVIDESWTENGANWNRSSLYERWRDGLPGGTLYLYFLKHDLFVEVNDGHVRSARALYTHNREHATKYLAKHTGTASMNPSTPKGRIP